MVDTTDTPSRRPVLRTAVRGERHLVIDPDTGSWAVLGAGAKRVLDACDGTRDVGGIAAMLGLPAAQVCSTVQGLFGSGVAGLNGRAVVGPDRFTAFRERYPTLGIIHTSNDCNLRCRYCYAHPPGCPPGPMPLAVMTKAIKEMLGLQAGGSVSVEFHGGEPLACLTTIHEAVHLGEDEAGEVSCAITWQLQSNGTLLDDRVIRFVKDHEVRLRVSLDGPQHLNDVHRVFPDGRGSFSKVFENMVRLRDGGVEFELLTVLTTTNVDYVEEILRFFTDNGFYRVRFIPMWVQGSASEGLRVPPAHLAERYMGLVRRVVEHNLEQATPVDYLNLKFITETLVSWNRSFMCLRSPCGAGTDMVDFSVEGNVYPCEEMNELPGLSIGNIMKTPLRQMVDASELVKTIRRRRVDSIQACRDCTWKRFCGGGCTNKSHLKYRSFERESDLCEFYKLIFEELMWYLSETPGAARAIMMT